MSTDYNTQSQDFIDLSKIRIIKTFTGNKKHFTEDKETRDTYNIRIERIEDSTKYFSFDFGDSIHNTELRKKDRKFLSTTASLPMLRPQYRKEYDEIKN